MLTLTGRVTGGFSLLKVPPPVAVGEQLQVIPAFDPPAYPDRFAVVREGELS